MYVTFTVNFAIRSQTARSIAYFNCLFRRSFRSLVCLDRSEQFDGQKKRFPRQKKRFPPTPLTNTRVFFFFFSLCKLDRLDEYLLSDSNFVEKELKNKKRVSVRTSKFTPPKLRRKRKKKYLSLLFAFRAKIFRAKKGPGPPSLLSVSLVSRETRTLGEWAWEKRRRRGLFKTDVEVQRKKPAESRTL